MLAFFKASWPWQPMSMLEARSLFGPLVTYLGWQKHTWQPWELHMAYIPCTSQSPSSKIVLKGFSWIRRSRLNLVILFSQMCHIVTLHIALHCHTTIMKYLKSDLLRFGRTPWFALKDKTFVISLLVHIWYSLGAKEQFSNWLLGVFDSCIISASS